MSDSRNSLPWAGALVFIAAVLAYHNSLQGPLVLDDPLAVTHNPSIRSLWPLGPVFSPPAECTVAGRPVANLTFALNYAVGGTGVWGYHAVNLGLHALSALLLFGVVRRTFLLAGNSLNSQMPASRPLGVRAQPLAAIAAALWAVHPLLSAAVSYISQRTELLMAFFYLATLYAFIRGATGGGKGWLLLSVVACWLGIGSKETMVTAPLLVLLYDTVFVAGSFKAALMRRRWYYAGLAASWGLLAALMAGLSHREVGFGLGITWWRYALAECEAVLTYFKLIIWPSPLVFDYGPLVAASTTRTAAYAAGLFAGLIGVGFCCWRRPRLGFALAAFLILLAPTSSVVPIATQPIAENRVYLASAPVVVAGVVGLFALLGRGFWVVGATAGLALLVATHQRNEIFRDKVRLWEDNAGKRPLNPRSFANLGEAAIEAGNLELARKRFEQALSLRPEFVEARNNLGVVLHRLGRPDLAVLAFNEVLRLKPDFISALNNLGNALLQAGKPQDAQVQFETALRWASEPHRLVPDFPEIHNSAGNALLYQGKFGDALGHYEKAASLRTGGYPEAEMNAGVALRLLGRFPEARTRLERALALQPQYPEAHFNMALTLVPMGQIERAQGHLEEAVRQRPTFVQARQALGDLALQQGRREAAHAHYQSALELQPNDAGLRQRWEMTAPRPR